jgi:hypothetical protein
MNRKQKLDNDDDDDDDVAFIKLYILILKETCVSVALRLTGLEINIQTQKNNY